MHMKKIIVFVSLFVAGITANAQFYMGGSAGLEVISTSYDNGSESLFVFQMEVYPELGYFVTERLSVGSEVGFGIVSNSNLNKTELNLRFIPYVRYSFFQAGKFQVLAKGSLNPEFREKYTYFGIHIDPILAYNVSERVMLQTNLKFLTFRTYYEANKDRDSTVGFKLGANADHLATFSSLTFGFIYKF